MKKIGLFFIILIISFTLVSCSGLDTVQERLESEGYRMEKLSEEDLENYFPNMDEDMKFKNLYMVYDPEDEYVGLIYEFSSERALKNVFDDINAKEEDYEQYVYKNLYIQSSTEELRLIFKGE